MWHFKPMIASLLAATTLLALPAVAQQKPSIKVGAILPMTGPLGAAGLMFRTGIDIAVESINAQGGVNGSRIELVVEDDKFNPQESVLMFRKHAGQGVVAVLGPIHRVHGKTSRRSRRASRCLQSASHLPT